MQEVEPGVQPVGPTAKALVRGLRRDPERVCHLGPRRATIARGHDLGTRHARRDVGQRRGGDGKLEVTRLLTGDRSHKGAQLAFGRRHAIIRSIACSAPDASRVAHRPTSAESS